MTRECADMSEGKQNKLINIIISRKARDYTLLCIISI